MKRFNILDFLNRINIDYKPYVEECIRIGDQCAMRHIQGETFRKNYERAILLTALAHKFQLNNFLEFGTGRGYSTGCLARLASPPLESLVTIDLKDQSYAKDKFDELGISKDNITFIQNNADTMHSDEFKQLFDFIFIDAKHREESVRLNFKLAKEVMSMPCIIVFDDYRKKYEPIQKFIDSLEFDQKVLISTDGWIIENTKIQEHDNADLVIDGKEHDSGMVIGTFGFDLEVFR